MDNNRFEYFCRTKTAYGKNALDHLPADLMAMGAGKPLVVANKAIAANGVTAHLIDAFKESGMILGIYVDAGENASIDTLRELTDLYNNKGFDAIIALGGGIVADLCKLLNIVVTNGPNTLKASRGKDNIEAPLRPLVYIPSGPGTGMETSKYATLADDTYASEFLMPDIAVIDPRMFLDQPWETVVDAALHCLANCLESYATADNPLIRAYAHTALGLITETLPALAQNAFSEEGDSRRPKNQSNNQEHLARLAKAVVINGYIISNCETLTCWQLGRILSQKCSAPEGVCMAITLPHLLEYLSKKEEMGGILLPLVGIEDFCTTPDASKFVHAQTYLGKMLDDLHRVSHGRVPRTLAEAGIGQKDLADIAASLPTGNDIEAGAVGRILDNAHKDRPTISNDVMQTIHIPSYYEFCCKVKTVAGHDALERIPGLLADMGARYPMIITDRGVSRAGIAAVVTHAIEDKVSIGSIEDDVPPDSDLKVVNRIASIYRQKGCDAIIAVGGGSVLDTAKGVNIVVSEDADDLMRFTGAGALKRKLNPLIAVPTTAGTGSEMTLVAVIADHDRSRKMLFTSYFLQPDAAVIDSRMTLTLPPHIAAPTAMDALTHAVEAYTCLANNPLSDAHAMEAIEMVSNNIMTVMASPDDADARLALGTAAALAGIAFSNSMVGMVHTLGHSLGSVCRVPHGTGMSILLPYGLEYNMHKIEDRVADLLFPLAGAKVYAETARDERAQKTVQYLRDLNRKLHKATNGTHATSLGEVVDGNGNPMVPKNKLPQIARTALGDGSIFYNPEELDYEDCLMVLEAARQGDILDRSKVRKG